MRPVFESPGTDVADYGFGGWVAGAAGVVEAGDRGAIDVVVGGEVRMV